MLFDKYFTPENIPERLYALLAMVESGEYTKNQLRDTLVPRGINQNTNDFNPVYNAAIKSNLIKEDEMSGKVVSLINQDISTIDLYKRYMAKKAFGDKRTLFFQFTSWYIGQNEQVFFYKSAEELSSKLTGDFIDVDKSLVLGWRFWASFLGIGFLHGTFLIPNMANRIYDSIYIDRSFEINKEISFADFIDYIIKICPELEYSIKGRLLPIGLSNGLRTLHDMGKLQLIYTPDSHDMWQLYRVESHQIRETVTGIMLKEGIYE